MRPVIISLFDFTGEAVRPWAEAGYEAACYDIQHEGRREAPAGDGLLVFNHWNADKGISEIASEMEDRDVRFVFSFTPCTDLTGAGSRHWESKSQEDLKLISKSLDMDSDEVEWAPDQNKRRIRQMHAVAWAKLAPKLAEKLGAGYLVENPRGLLSTLWRKPDHWFDPCDYGGYIPEAEAAHPIWPEIIPPRDAYTKKTGLWTSDDFVMPAARPVEPVLVELTLADGTKTKSSPMWAKLGGKSLKTKNIRSASPRGFFKAVFEANR